MYIICFGTVLLMGLGGVLFSSFIFGAGQWPSDPSTLQLPPSISRKFTLELKDGIWMVSWWPPMRVCPQNAQPFTSTSSLHNHSNKLCARSAWTSVWIPTSCTNTPLYSCDRPEANDWRPSRRKTGSKSVSKPNCTTWKSAQKKKKKKKTARHRETLNKRYRKALAIYPASSVGSLTGGQESSARFRFGRGSGARRRLSWVARTSCARFTAITHLTRLEPPRSSAIFRWVFPHFIHSKLIRNYSCVVLFFNSLNRICLAKCAPKTPPKFACFAPLRIYGFCLCAWYMDHI